MTVSRRTFITSVAAGSALAAVGALPRPAGAASPPGDVVGKITVGYQGWFACTGDGAPINGWWHWSQNWSQPPSPSNNAIKAWPDMQDYARGYQTAYANPVRTGRVRTACSRSGGRWISVRRSG